MTAAPFIVIEGPSSAGVSTCANQLTAELTARQKEVWLTGEPTATPWGQMLVDLETEMTPRAYALAVAADRATHVDHIAQATGAGMWVISDRYVHSSLVRHRAAEVPLTEIWAYNQRVAIPDLTVYLHAAPEVLESRLDRDNVADEALDPARQFELYKQTLAFLGSRGWRVATIECTGLDVDEVTAQALDAVAQLER